MVFFSTLPWHKFSGSRKYKFYKKKILGPGFYYSVHEYISLYIHTSQ